MMEQVRVGAAGDILTSTGTGVAWSSTIPAGLCCNIQNTLTAGHVTVGQGMSMTATSPLTLDATSNITSAGTNTWNGTNTFTSDIEVDGTIEDGTGSVGGSRRNPKLYRSGCCMDCARLP